MRTKSKIDFQADSDPNRRCGLESFSGRFKRAFAPLASFCLEKMACRIIKLVHLRNSEK